MGSATVTDRTTTSSIPPDDANSPLYTNIGVKNCSAFMLFYVRFVFYSNSQVRYLINVIYVAYDGWRRLPHVASFRFRLNVCFKFKLKRFCQPNPSFTSVVTNLSLYTLYYAEACNEFAGPISASLRLRATKLLLEKCRSGGEPLATLCSI